MSASRTKLLACVARRGVTAAGVRLVCFCCKEASGTALDNAGAGAVGLGRKRGAPDRVAVDAAACRILQRPRRRGTVAADGGRRPQPDH